MNLKLRSLCCLPVAIAGIITFSACGGKNDKIAKPPGGGNKEVIMQVEGYIVKARSLGANVEVPGSLVANQSTELHPEISGRIVQLNVSEGRQISQGMLIAKLYDADLQATLKKLHVQLQIANQNEQRSLQLIKIQGISQQDYDASLLNVNNIKADIEITQATIIKTEIRAPFNGKVGLKNISMGAFVTPATIVATIQQTDILKLDFSVPEKYIPQIKVGQPVQFTTEGNTKNIQLK